MKNLKFSRLFAALTVVAVLVLAGCKTADETGSIYGTWLDASAYGNSYYKITQTTFENYGEDQDGNPYDSYAGNELTLVPVDSASGMIYIKYTRAADSSWNYTTDSTLAPDIGKWYAISYKDLTKDSVKISGAYNQTRSTSCDTLEEAKQEFTAGNGYFNNYSSCSRQ